MNKRVTGALFAVLSCAMAYVSVHAESGRASSSAGDFPNKPLRFVVGLAPGGATDIIARLIGQKLSDVIGQPVIVDNRSGAAGSIGAGMVAKAEPDGYTLLVVSSSFAINPVLYELPFDSLKDFEPVVQIGQAPFLLVVTPSLPVQNVKDLIALAKSKPGALNFSSGGHGGSGHMAGELFKRMASIQVEHVPYRGGSPAVTAVIGGQVQFTFSAIVAGLRHRDAGRLRALAVTSAKRSKAAPDIPTVEEAGVPGYEVLTWYGILAPEHTPNVRIRKLNEATNTILRMPEVVRRIESDGAETVGGAPAQFRKHLANEISRFKKLVSEMGIQRKGSSLR